MWFILISAVTVLLCYILMRFLFEYFSVVRCRLSMTYPFSLSIVVAPVSVFEYFSTFKLSYLFLNHSTTLSTAYLSCPFLLCLHHKLELQYFSLNINSIIISYFAVPV